jgi:predicted transcriptional regulator of viral defense system
MWHNTGMEFEELLKIVGDRPLFKTSFLLAGAVKPKNIQRQLVRWTQSGKLYQLRRGLYALRPPYQKTKPHPFLIANRLVEPSYVSLQSALAHYGLIPEYVPLVTSITTGRPQEVETPLGRFKYQHIKQDLFHSFHRHSVSAQQEVYLAVPEKALLDLIYLQPGGDELPYLRELRLQNLAHLDAAAFQELAVQSESPKLIRAAESLAALMEQESETSYETLFD